MEKMGFIVSLLFGVIFFSCKPPTELTHQDSEKKTYMSLSIGDIHQYKNEMEDVHFQWKVIDTVRRSDNQKVFKIEELLLDSKILYSAENYYYLSEKYFISTQLDTVDSLVDCQNPFSENRLAKIHPNNFDYFLINNCVMDDAKIFMAVTMIDTLTTFAKTFYDVARYSEITNDSISNNIVFYAKDFGHVGTIYTSKYGVSKIFINYYKSNSVEFGKYYPIKPSIMSIKRQNLISYIFN